MLGGAFYGNQQMRQSAVVTNFGVCARERPIQLHIKRESLKFGNPMVSVMAAHSAELLILFSRRSRALFKVLSLQLTFGNELVLGSAKALSSIDSIT
jgi:hypothetical protein